MARSPRLWAGLVAALGLLAAASPAGAQYRQPGALAAAREAPPPPPIALSAPLAPAPAAPRPAPAGESQGRTPYARFALWGTGIGAGVGLAGGLLAMRNSGCNDCWLTPPREWFPAVGLVAGAAVGLAAGSVLYLLDRAVPPRPEQPAARAGGLTSR